MAAFFSSLGFYFWVFRKQYALLRNTSRKWLIMSSLRSKRFQSSYCAKVRARAKKKKKVPSFPSPSPVIPLFLLSSQLSRRTREETLATQARSWGTCFFLCPSILKKGSFLQNSLGIDVQDVHKLFIENLSAIFVKFHLLSLKSPLKRFFRGFRVFDPFCLWSIRAWGPNGLNYSKMADELRNVRDCWPLNSGKN